MEASQDVRSDLKFLFTFCLEQLKRHTFGNILLHRLKKFDVSHF